MTDKEMIELAAKAAGIDVWWTDEYGGKFLRQRGCPVIYSPLTNDAQAFRLSVKLNLSYSINGPYVVVHGYAFPNLVIHKFEGDVLDAVRMAIVMAAAEIGKGM